jgi:hypothetical protein
MKALTRQQTQARKDRAVAFLLNVKNDPEPAAEVEQESLDDYAQRRRIRLSNPNRRTANMATNAELESTLEEIGDLVDEALDPELTREELVAKLKEIAQIVEGDSGEDLEDDEDLEDQD